MISIHAPRKGERLYACHVAILYHVHFNPRSPQGGATRLNFVKRQKTGDFNPRSPQGGATPQLIAQAKSMMDFNPRSPQGGATYYLNAIFFF